MTPDDIARLPYRRNVGVMLVNARGRVFTGQRRDRFEEAWQMPQGGIDPGESPHEAALRELQEETGVTRDLVETLAETETWLPYDLPADLVPQIWNGRFRGQEQKWFLMRYRGRDDQIDIATDHPEFSAWRWMDPDQVLAHIVDFKRGVYARVLEEFAPYLARRD